MVKDLKVCRHVQHIKSTATRNKERTHGWNLFNKCKHCTPSEDMTDTLVLRQTL